MEKVEKKGIGKRKDLVLLITVSFIVPICPLSAKCGGKKQVISSEMYNIEKLFAHFPRII